jgi:hypothetical protein
MAQIVIEGQTHIVADWLVNNGASLAQRDQNLREALRPNFDLAADATFQRVEKDGVQTVTVIKNPGRKGGDHAFDRVVRRLLAAPGELTPMMTVACELQIQEARGQLDCEALIRWRSRIERVLEEGSRDQRLVTAARRRLLEAPTIPSSVVPVGL